MIEFARRQALPGLLLLSLTFVAAPASAGWHHRHQGHQGSHDRDDCTDQASDKKSSRPQWSGWQHSHASRHWHHGRSGDWVCDALRAHSDHIDADSEMAQFLVGFFGCETPEETPEPPPEMPQAPLPLATLLDEAGTPVADLGRVETDHTTIAVPAASSFADPVVILGPPTRRDADPGTAQLQAVDGEGFQVHFAEWTYLDGEHAAEAVSYLILAPGRHQMADGSEWEAGSLDVADAGSFSSQTFGSPFAATPALFLTVQTRNDDDPVVVRAREVSASGFQAALMEEEGADGMHGAERIGYLAVSSPPGSGQLASATGALPYLVDEVLAGHLSVPVLSGSLALEEEASADDELDHADETLAFLAIGPQVFAQTMTYDDTDPVTLRRNGPEQDADMEWGTFSSVDDMWHTIPLSRQYADPVVVVGPASSNGADPGVLRTRNVRGDSFELRFQEWPYLNQIHTGERAFYMVADRGVQSLGGLMVEAGHADTSAVLSEGLQTVEFTFDFPEVPGVFASVNSENDPQPVMVRVGDRTTMGFGMAMQSEQANAGGHGVERLGWIAIQAGQGTTSDGRSVEVLDIPVDHTGVTVTFGAGPRGRFPSVVAQIASVLGADPVALRFQDLTSGSIGLVAQEETSADSETSHIAEDVSVFIAE
jgi:hypothetical protein